MRILKKAKNNLFLCLVVAAYLGLFFFRQELAIESVKSSGYYIKEMLMIMPVIFVLTALLDLWVPKEKIMAYLGKESKSKGLFFSFILGSISAGPVYAAFPMCAMLYKKGASIRNIVIILSSWAVIKVPMLINEAKFLGPKFMILRWILTVLAILIFSKITEKAMGDEEIVTTTVKQKGLFANEESCIGCGLCARIYPEAFHLKKKKAVVIKLEQPDLTKLKSSIDACPVQAISYNEA